MFKFSFTALHVMPICLLFFRHSRWAVLVPPNLPNLSARFVLCNIWRFFARNCLNMDETKMLQTSYSLFSSFTLHGICWGLQDYLWKCNMQNFSFKMIFRKQRHSFEWGWINCFQSPTKCKEMLWHAQTANTVVCCLAFTKCIASYGIDQIYLFV